MVNNMKPVIPRIESPGRERNMKISPSKFQVGSNVTFGGAVIEAVQQVGDAKKTVFLSLNQEKLDAFLDFPKRDPHGDPIPDKEGNLQSIEKSLLATLQKGETGICVGVDLINGGGVLSTVTQLPT